MAKIIERVVMSQCTWEKLRSIKRGTPITGLAGHDARMIDDVYKISESKYCLTEIPVNSLNGIPEVVSIFWACSENAFRRAYLKEIEGDDLAVSPPPHELLPPQSGSTYRQILSGLKSAGAKGLMECASYRIMSDGAFVHRVIECDLAIYYFRSQESIDDELPYSILWKMKES